MDIGKLIQDASGGRARLISGNDAEDLLNNIKDAIREEQEKDCGNPLCPIHGEQHAPDSTLDGVNFNDFKPEDALRLATLSAGAAQLKFEGGKYREAAALQEQAAVWIAIRDASVPGRLETLSLRVSGLLSDNEDLEDRIEILKSSERERINRIGALEREVDNLKTQNEDFRKKFGDTPSFD